VERTSTGQLDTSKAVLERYHSYPICSFITVYRSLQTHRDWVRKLLRAVIRFGNPARFSFRSIGAPTARMAASSEGGKSSLSTGYVDVNIQSIPASDRRPERLISDRLCGRMMSRTRHLFSSQSTNRVAIYAPDKAWAPHA
jgi:hypothetical protein